MGQIAENQYQFGPFEANLETGELRRRGQPVKLQEQPFRLLAALLENAGEVVSREQIQSRIWPEGTFVDFDSGLRVAVRKLREALGDDADNPRYIETIPKRGYRFLYPVVRPAPSIRLPLQQLPELPEAPAPPKPPEIPVAAIGTQVASHRSAPLAKYVAGAVALIALATAGLFFWQRSVQAGPLTDKDVLVLADFANNTGDPVFDSTLRQALAIQLEQSPFLKTMDDEEVEETLQLMSQPRGIHITNQIAHDVCVREAAAATIDGSIASVGRSYVVTLQALNCQSGATLSREQSQASDKEHVLYALETAATAMRARLGESRSSIRKLNRPLEQVTSPSLEALQAFSAGHALLIEGKYLSAKPLFEHAVALDPKFAMAYFYLATAANNAGDTRLERDSLKKAFALSDRVSDFERDHIASGYYDSTGELDKTIDMLRIGSLTYPRAWNFHNNMSEAYINLGKFEDGLREGQAANLLQPDAEPPYRRLLDAYMSLDQLNQANAVAAQLRKLKLGGARIHQRLLELAYVEDDQASVARELEWFSGKPEEYLSFGLQAAWRSVHGRRREAASLYKQASSSAWQQDLHDVAAQFEEDNALAQALTGGCAEAHHLGRPALALALCGEAKAAERSVAETSQLFPKGLIWNRVEMPAIRAATALRESRPEKVVELLTAAVPYERAYPVVAFLRGQAYLRLRKGAEAAAEFRKITDHKGLSWATAWRNPHSGLFYAGSCLGLAQAMALTGDQRNARIAFDKFFTLWKDADRDIPVLAQAKAEYANLR